MRLGVKIVDLALGYRQAGIHVDPIRFHSADRIGAAIPNQDISVFPSRSLVHERAKLTIIEALVAFNHCRDLAGFDGRLFLRIRLDLKNIDRMPDAGAVAMANKDAITRDPEAACVAFTIEVSAFPFSRDRKSTRLNSSHLVISYAVFCLKK